MVSTCKHWVTYIWFFDPECEDIISNTSFHYKNVHKLIPIHRAGFHQKFKATTHLLIFIQLCIHIHLMMNNICVHKISCIELHVFEVFTNWQFNGKLVLLRDFILQMIHLKWHVIYMTVILHQWQWNYINTAKFQWQVNTYTHTHTHARTCTQAHTHTHIHRW